jgi:histidyl-tRNA synthetase
VEDAARKLFDRYGYRRVETPLFEHTDVFTRAIGGASEIVLDKQMYTFLDRRERSLTLRPEGTAGVARAFVEHDVGKRETLPVRLGYWGWMFRYERPQKGRNRQFHQIGAECFGSDAPTVDAELIVLAAQFFEAIDLGPQLLLNSMGCQADRKRYGPVLREALGDRIDEMCEDCHERLKTNPLRVFDCKVASCKRILRGDVPPISEYLCEECRTHFAAVQGILETLGVAWKNDPHLVRGLDYYTRTVFEFELEGFGGRPTVCGGGRYDGLVEMLGGQPTPAAGFAVGTEPVLVALRDAREPKGWRPDVYVVWLEGTVDIAMATALDLRAAGLRVLVSDEAKSLKAQLRAADRVGAAKVVILGPDEVAKRIATVRDLSSGEQREVPLAGLGKELSG